MAADINHLIKLANIKMTDQEIVLLSKQLDNIIYWLDFVSKIDTTNIEPMYNRLQDLQILHLQNKDNIDKNNVDKILQNAPEVFDNFIIVPKILDS